MKGERMAKRSSFGNIMRRRLSDITNTQAQHKLVGLMIEQSQISESNEDLINQLLQVKQEKEMLLKLVEERNKIIELSGNKLRDLRMNYQKLQAQNWNLAQSNSQMLAELNLGREKLKALQHEIVCKEALLKAKNLGPQVSFSFHSIIH
ncbi:SHUGOSHIN 1 [Populus alba]|uniref:SHUGOSHIN 1 n=1 Tax=Populus alba TaxID=43335 RepID=UPI003CC71424